MSFSAFTQGLFAQEDAAPSEAQSSDSGQSSTLDTVKETAKGWADKASQLSKEHLSGSTILLGIGRTSLGGDGKDFGNAGWQWGLQYNRSFYSILDNLTLKGALDFRYSSHKKDLDAVRLGNTNATASMKRYDYSILAGLHYGLIDHAALFTEFGPSIQSRSFWIDAESGGDYYRSSAFGYMWRLGAQYYCVTSFGNIVTNLFYSMSNGAKAETGNTKYNLKKIDYNSPANTIGVEFGLTL